MLDTSKRTVHVYVFDGLADWEVGLAIAYLNTPAFQPPTPRYCVATVGTQMASVVSMGGIRMVPDQRLDALNPADSAMLILPGGTTWDEGKNVEAAEKAREFLAAGVPVAAICGATAGIARAGLLDDRRHTSNTPEYLQATGYAGGALYDSARAVTDKNLITAGSTGALDFARHIFAALDLYPPAAIDAWYHLFRTGEPQYFAALMSALGIAA